jgi:hypothetical protein
MLQRLYLNKKLAKKKKMIVTHETLPLKEVLTTTLGHRQPKGLTGRLNNYPNCIQNYGLNSTDDKYNCHQHGIVAGGG